MKNLIATVDMILFIAAFFFFTSGITVNGKHYGYQGGGCKHARYVWGEP